MAVALADFGVAFPPLRIRLAVRMINRPGRMGYGCMIVGLAVLVAGCSPSDSQPISTAPNFVAAPAPASAPVGGAPQSTGGDAPASPKSENPAAEGPPSWPHPGQRPEPPSGPKKG